MDTSPSGHGKGDEVWALVKGLASARREGEQVLFGGRKMEGVPTGSSHFLWAWRLAVVSRVEKVSIATGEQKVRGQ